VLPEALLPELQAHVGTLAEVVAVGGGCISRAARVRAARGDFFLKFADGEAARTYEAEAAGLRALRDAAVGTGLCVPHVMHARNAAAKGGVGLLLLEWIPPGRPAAGYWERFGEGLAALHRAQVPGEGRYGFGGDNFIGRLPQRNEWRAAWPEFFGELRLLPQFEHARRTGRWRARWDLWAERLLGRLADWLPEAPHPSVLHGDLWSGNQLADAQGRAWLVDPAAYVGDREADLAMTALFGAFGPGFHAAYQRAWPSGPGHEDRRDLYNLYHLVNHLNHFGGSYAGQVEAVLARFGG
jgi:protein-ribulosamine 3-kinase